MKILDSLKIDLAISTFKGLENHIVSLVRYKKIKGEFIGKINFALLR